MAIGIFDILLRRNQIVRKTQEENKSSNNRSKHEMSEKAGFTQ